MPRSAHPDATLVILFTRLPEPGRTKTRLIPLLGAEGAAAAARQLTERALATVHASGLPWVVALADGAVAEAETWLGAMGQVVLQAGGDLGQRMAAAFAEAFTAGWARVLLMGTDVPELTAGHLAAAAAALASPNDAVLIPAHDGGYGLIGLRQPAPALFEGIAWSTADVLAQTQAAAAQAGLALRLFDPLPDIDTPEDWSAWQARSAAPLSVVIPTLNEAAALPATLAALQNHADGVALDVVVADGGSTDDTRAIAIANGARVVSARARGAQMNAGAAAAHASALLFLHADTLVPPGFAHQALSALAGDDVALAAYHLKISDADWRLRLVEAGANLRSRWLGLPYGDQGLALRRVTFAALGGFADLPILEDYQLVRAARHHGPIVLMAGAVVTAARRWRHMGIARTWLINQAMLIGYHCGLAPERLSRLYRAQRK